MTHKINIPPDVLHDATGTADGLDLMSVGHLCGLFSRTPRQIADLAEALGERPMLRLDGVAYYSDGQAARILARIREVEAAKR